jgi:hypothetical protein
MSEKINGKKSKEKKGILERGSRFGRDFNIAVGGIALVGAAITPPLIATGLGIYAAINFAQAGGFELARRHAKKKQVKKSTENK